MSLLRSVAWMLFVVVMSADAGLVRGQATSTGSGQDFPNKPIRIVTSEPGGGGHIVARVLAQGMSSSLGQQVIVDNRSGAIPGEIVAKTQPDGYNLLLHGGSFYLAPFMQKLPYDVQKDFAAIIRKLNQEAARVLHQPEVKERFFNAGTESVGGTPEQFAAVIKREISKWGKVIKDAGIRAE